MNHCSTCHYENGPNSVYCYRCGAYLAASSSPFEPIVKAFDETLIPPPPPLSSYQQAPVEHPRSTSKNRTVAGTVFSVVLYMWGILVLTVGLIGGFFYFIQSNPVIFIIIYLFISLVFLIPLLLYRTRVRLKWGKRLALEIGLLVIGFILIAIVSQAVNPTGNTSSTANHLIGVSLVLYGLATAFVAFW